jgi:hypothetical protein
VPIPPIVAAGVFRQDHVVKGDPQLLARHPSQDLRLEEPLLHGEGVAVPGDTAVVVSPPGNKAGEKGRASSSRGRSLVRGPYCPVIHRAPRGASHGQRASTTWTPAMGMPCSLRLRCAALGLGEGSRGGDQPRPHPWPRAQKNRTAMGRGLPQPFVQQMGKRHHRRATPGGEILIRDNRPRVQVLKAARGRGAGDGRR